MKFYQLNESNLPLIGDLTLADHTVVLYVRYLDVSGI